MESEMCWRQGMRLTIQCYSDLACSGNIWHYNNHHQELFKTKHTETTKACQGWNEESCEWRFWVTAGQSRQTASVGLLHFIFTACQMQHSAVSLTESSLNKCHLWRAFTDPDLTHLLPTLQKSWSESLLIECVHTDGSQICKYHIHP